MVKDGTVGKFVFLKGILYMISDIKIGVLGGDMRQFVLACELARLDFEVAVYGFDLCDGSAYCEGDDESKLATKCTTPDCAIRASTAVILPIPVSCDNVMLNCPLSSKGGIKIADILEKCKNTLVIGGRISPEITALCDRLGVEYVDFFKREELQIANSVPTAEGAIEVALRELDITLNGSSALVAGYGRIGSVLAQKLAALGAKTSVFARRSEVRAQAEAMGFNTVGSEAFADSCKNADVIFNTVPEVIIDKNILKKMKKSTVIVDLASKPGGVDFDFARERGITAVWALALPGKTAPITAGRIIKNCVMDILREKEII